MAAGLALREEAEGWRRLLRAVTRLQACVRGYLLRKRFQSLRAEYEAVVLEIEGDLSRLEWRGQFLPRPVFITELPPPQVKCPGPQEAVPGDEASTEKPPEELDTPEPQRDGVCGTVTPAAQPQGQEEPSSAGEDDAKGSPDPGSEKGCSARAEGQEGQEESSVPAWDSTVPEEELLKASLEIPLEDIKELPRSRSGLQAYRTHLVMELLWLEQAIASRENYLKLKQTLGTPDP